MLDWYVGECKVSVPNVNKRTPLTDIKIGIPNQILILGGYHKKMTIFVYPSLCRFHTIEFLPLCEGSWII